MKCQKCGAELLSGSRFCSECGTEQPKSSAENELISEYGVKICKNCNAQIPADSRFCPECSAKQDVDNTSKAYGYAGVQATRSLTNEELEKIKKRNKVIAIAVGAALALCGVIGIISAFIKPSINLNDYLEVSFDGYDTVGKAKILFNTEKFENDYEKALLRKRPKGNVSIRLSESDMFDLDDDGVGDDFKISESFLTTYVGGEADKQTGLSNGDVVTFKWNCDDAAALEDYGYKLKHEDKEYTVEGLKEAEKFNPFEGLEVKFSGVAPSGVAYLEGKAASEEAQHFSYNLDNERGLSNGDKVVLSLTTYYGEDPIEYSINEFGKIPSPIEQEYTVTGLSKYVAGMDDITDEFLQGLNEQAEKEYRGQSWYDDEELKSFDYIGCYLLTTKDTENEYRTNNILYTVYKVQINNTFSNSGETYNEINTVYWCLTYENVMIAEDGTCTVKQEKGHQPYHEVKFDSGINCNFFYTRSWSYSGYESIDELFNEEIKKKENDYDHVDSIDESKASEIATSESSEGVSEEADAQESEE